MEGFVCHVVKVNAIYFRAERRVEFTKVEMLECTVLYEARHVGIVVLSEH